MDFCTFEEVCACECVGVWCGAIRQSRAKQSKAGERQKVSRPSQVRPACGYGCGHLALALALEICLSRRVWMVLRATELRAPERTANKDGRIQDSLEMGLDVGVGVGVIGA